MFNVFLVGTQEGYDGDNLVDVEGGVRLPYSQRHPRVM
jgi:hypothetical protein